MPQLGLHRVPYSLSAAIWALAMLLCLAVSSFASPALTLVMTGTGTCAEEFETHEVRVVSPRSMRLLDSLAKATLTPPSAAETHCVCDSPARHQLVMVSLTGAGIRMLC